MANHADLEETAAAVRQSGRRVLARQADVRDLPALAAAADEAVTEFGRLDVIVANAGIASYGAAAELSEQQWDEMVAINLSGVWRTVRACIGHMRAGGNGGSVILVSSASGLRGIPNTAHYAAAKHGLVGLMKVLALELGPENIRVNTIHPTTVSSPMTQNQATRELFLPGRPAHKQTQEAFARVSQSLNVMPVPWLQPGDVSDLVAFLASDEARYITGTSIPVDAGMAIRW
jgi:(+)-trans-carveol dehydrogenase